MLTDELDYDLPAHLIAHRPAPERDAARLMVVHRQTQRIEHCHVRDLPELSHVLRSGDLMVFNRSKVLPAQFRGIRQGTGGQVKGLYLNSDGKGEPGGAIQWQVMLESGGKLRPGDLIQLDADAELELLEQLGGGCWRTRLHSEWDTLALLARIGSPPLPPYIRKARQARHLPQANVDDARRYNTVFADEPGSVAAPTAGLHFTPELLERLDQHGIERTSVTLHIGLGTFAPIRAQRVEDHQMHSEWIGIRAPAINALRQARRQGRRIIPVGTTSVRALESLPPLTDLGDRDFSTHTNLFIVPVLAAAQPGFAFRFTDALLTNFHLPRSTLLALVAALPGVGIDNLMAWYRQAIDRGYRFYSYGDAMLLV